MELVDKQIEYQQLLIEEAKERLQAAKERRKMVTVQWKSAEMNLRLKINELKAHFSNA